MKGAVPVNAVSVSIVTVIITHKKVQMSYKARFIEEVCLEGGVVMTRKFPFNIMQVAKILNLKVQYQNDDSGNIDIDCPFCNKKSKMNLNIAKNVYRCNSCNEYIYSVITNAPIPPSKETPKVSSKLSVGLAAAFAV